VTWASHLAITDEQGNQFMYGQRAVFGPEADLAYDSGIHAAGFQLAVPAPGHAPSVDDSYGRPIAAPGAWSMRGFNGHDHLTAALSPVEAATSGHAFGIDATVEPIAGRPVVLEDTDGWVDFGPAGGSYYYSRTRLNISATVSLDGQSFATRGTTWFDHQWGDFISVGGGGWDWFAVNLADRSDLTLSLVRAADGSYPLVYGTYVAPDGTTSHLDRSAFTVSPTGTWTSPTTGATYPSGWHVAVPALDLAVDLAPTVADQELDTRPTTGVVYWEGSQVVHATRGRTAVGGQAYVELTGYQPRP
jgi:predicted secreted hydrolase